MTVSDQMFGHAGSRDAIVYHQRVGFHMLERAIEGEVRRTPLFFTIAK